MSESVRDSFLDLERHRLMLEQNVAKLRASLEHWQAWEIDYEGMKEDILGLGDGANSNDLEDLNEDAVTSVFLGQGPLLTAKERQLLLRDEKGHLRQIQQVLGLLSRRIDYVQRNIKTVSNLLSTAEKKYVASQVLIQPEVRNEEGLPLTEILEELDVDGNVISGSTSESGQAAPQVVEALRRNGMTDLPLSDVDVGQPQDIIDGQARSGDDNATPAVSVQNISQSKGSESIASNPSAPVSRNATGRSPKSRKSVSFAKDTKIGGASTPQPRSMKGMKDKINQAKTPQLNDDGITQDPVVDSEKPGTILHGEEDATFNPVIPTNEAPEDAALRQDMIQYNMGEVGAIVAELDFDEDETTNSDDESGGEDYDGSSVEDEEDQFGRTRRRVLTNGYLAEMQKLQERLKNIGPLSTRGDVPLANSGDLNLEHSQNAVSNDSPQLPSPLAKKEVRFANELDIQDAHTKATTNPLLSASHASKPPDVHRKPTHTPKVIERPFMTSTSSSKPNEPDEYDPALIHQEVMTEYHRMRNHVIQRQGGFNARDEDEESGEVPLTEAEGGPRKLSRFKAARLGKLGA